MPEFSDYTDLGFFPLQDHDQDVPLHLRQMLAGGRIKRFREVTETTTKDENIVEVAREGDKGTFGDIHPWTFIQTEDRSDRGMGSWAQLFGGVVSGGSNGGQNGPGTFTAAQQPLFSPFRDDFYLFDERYKQRALRTPIGLAVMPRGAMGIQVGGTQENSREDLLLPADNRLFAPMAAGPAEAGTLVVDMQPDGEVCMDTAYPGVGGRHARLQSLVRVVPMNPTADISPEPNILALNYGTTEIERMGGRGAIYGPVDNARFGGGTRGAFPSPSPVGGPNDDAKEPGQFGRFQPKARQGYGVAFMAHRTTFGPIHLGAGFGDKHLIGRDRDGHPMTSAHIHTGAFFFNDSDRDAPLAFEGDYKPGGTFPLTAKVTLGYDRFSRHACYGGTAEGLWRWYTTVPYLAPGTPDTPGGGPGQPGTPPGQPPTTPPTTPPAIPPRGPTTPGGPGSGGAPGTPGTGGPGASAGGSTGGGRPGTGGASGPGTSGPGTGGPGVPGIGQPGGQPGSEPGGTPDGGDPAVAGAAGAAAGAAAGSGGGAAAGAAGGAAGEAGAGSTGAPSREGKLDGTRDFTTDPVKPGEPAPDGVPRPEDPGYNPNDRIRVRTPTTDPHMPGWVIRWVTLEDFWANGGQPGEGTDDYRRELEAQKTAEWAAAMENAEARREELQRARDERIGNSRRDRLRRQIESRMPSQQRVEALKLQGLPISASLQEDIERLRDLQLELDELERTPPGTIRNVGESADQVGAYSIFHPMQEAFSAIAFRPQLWVDGEPNFEHNPSEDPEEYRQEEITRPQVMVMRPWGNQGAATVDWDYDEQPGVSRARGGTVRGGVLLMPPQTEMEDYVGIGLPLADLNEIQEQACFAMAPGICLAFGQPDIQGGGMQPTGVKLGQPAASVNANRPLTMAAINSVGANVPLATFELDQPTGEPIVKLEGEQGFQMPAGDNAARPTNPATGMMRTNTQAAPVVEFYNGSTWTTLEAGSGGGGPGVTDHGALTGLADDDHPQYLRADGSRALAAALDLGGNRITNLGQATVAGEAVEFVQAVTFLNAKLNLTGGTLSGILNMGGNRISNVLAGSTATDAVNRAQLDTKLDLAGGTLTGSVAFPDNQGVTLGSGGDATIRFTGTNLQVTPNAVGSGYLEIGGNALVVPFGGDDGRPSGTEGMLRISTQGVADVLELYDSQAATWVTVGPDAGGGAGDASPRSFIHLGKTSGAQQNHGGSNGTTTYVSWDSQIATDPDFTHSTSTNNTRITVNATARYEIKATVGMTQGGGARTTQMLRYRINGGTIQTRGTSRNYTRGANYGDMSVHLFTEVDLSSGDYIELCTVIDDSDGSYTQNTRVAECEFILRKLT